MHGHSPPRIMAMADADSLPTTTDSSPDAEDNDWPARASATVVQYVGTVREKTTGPALVASRSVVYLVTMALIGAMILILALILLVRMLVSVTAYVPGVEPGETWLAYLLLGSVFAIVGLVLWRMKEPRASAPAAEQAV